MAARLLVTLGYIAKLVTSSPAPVADSGSVCSKAPYSLILPFSNYAPAQSFCSSKYPVKPITTVTQTTTVTAGGKKKRGTNTTPKKTTTTKTTTTPDSNSSKFKSCTSRLSASGALSTACSCIESPITATTTTTITVMPTTPTTTTPTPTPSPSCTSGQTPDAFGDAFTIYCGHTFSDPQNTITQVPGGTQPDIYACASACNGIGYCCGALFNRMTLTCTYLQSTLKGNGQGLNTCALSSGPADDNLDFAVLDCVGSNPYPPGACGV